MNLRPTLLALCSALALPALAQMTPAQTNLDPAAARLEARNARADHQLTAVSPQQALANSNCSAAPCCRPSTRATAGGACAARPAPSRAA